MHFATQDFPPYHYSVDGEARGPIANVIRTVCHEMKVKCCFELLPWSRAQKMAEQNLVDGLFVLGKTPAREKWLAFTHPIVRAEYGFFVESAPICFTIRPLVI